MTTTFEKPTLKDFPAAPASGEATVSLSKAGKALTVQIPDSDISPYSSVHLTLGAASKPPEWTGNLEPMMVNKTPETHPDDFEVAELRKGVTLTVPGDTLKAFSGRLVELHYTFTYESGGADTSKPLNVRFKA
ncbi:hypothetical protein PHLH5_08160 [Pseudomonas sp. Cab53]|uniref:hypothetical protein n=1 Tax=unclassified Pseudomonas TaxID=196821 RepID=UPI001BB36CAA|nr:hypothetical protein [Pseudomonas sp. Cab53]BBP63275.1 hypothetical protein PHLH5_08160 [Pseudomonas sp. Cab53]